MKITVFYILFFFISCSGYTQRITFGMQFGTGLSSLRTKTNLFTNKTPSFARTMTGIVYFDISPKIQLITGAKFYTTVFDIKDYSILAPCDYQNQMVNKYSSFVKIEQLTKYAGIPIQIRMKFKENINHFYWRLGIDFFRVIQNKETLMLHLCDNITPLSSDLTLPDKNFLLNSNLAIGYEFRATNKLKFFFEPTIDFSLTDKFDKNQEVFLLKLPNHSNVLFVGLSVGLIYKVDKS